MLGALSCCFVLFVEVRAYICCFVMFCSFSFVEVKAYVWVPCPLLFSFVCSGGIELSLFGGRGIVLIRKLLQDFFSPMFSVFGYGYRHCFIIALLLLRYCFTHSLVSGEGEWATVLFFSEATEASR